MEWRNGERLRVFAILWEWFTHLNREERNMFISILREHNVSSRT